MKYTYVYKTSDGVRREAALVASSREAVFEALRSKGIRAIKVTAPDGLKANGEVRGVRGRVVAAVVLIALIAVVVAYMGGSRTGKRDMAAQKIAALPFLTDQTRRQVIGDVAVIEKGIRTGWSDVFASEGDRFLASFAIPGVKAGVRNTTIDEIERSLKETVLPTNQDSLEARQIKAMVEGMKREARNYLKAGGTVVEYGKRLVERQEAEIAVLKRVGEEVTNARKTLNEADFLSLYEKRNDELRNLGIRPVTLDD